MTVSGVAAGTLMSLDEHMAQEAHMLGRPIEYVNAHENHYKTISTRFLIYRYYDERTDENVRYSIAVGERIPAGGILGFVREKTA